MSRRTHAAVLCALSLVAIPGVAVAQDPTDEPAWPAAAKKGAADVAAVGDGFLMVGSSRKPLASKVWRSEDGQSWQRLKDDTFDGAAMARAESFDDGVVVLGRKGRRLVSWYSPDGTTWKRTTIDKADEALELVPYGLTSGPDGLLAVVSVIGQDIGSQRFYNSTDGRQWNIVEPPSADTGGIFTALEGTADEYLAIARPAFTESPNLYWHAPADTGWESFEGPVDGLIYDIAVGEDGSYVAVGALQGEDAPRPAIWHAAELGDWELVYSGPSAKEPEDRFELVEVGGPGYVAAGTLSACPQQAQRSCPRSNILVSADGRDWTPLGIAEGVPGPLHGTEVVSVASSGGDTVMLARHDRGPAEAWKLPAE